MAGRAYPTRLIDYQLFARIFTHPEMELGKGKKEDVVMGYLESYTVSDVPFRKAAQAHPDGFGRVMNHYSDRKNISAERVDDLMREFKPWTFEKLPSTVAILDNEMARLFRLAEEKEATRKTRSPLSRLKGLF